MEYAKGWKNKNSILGWDDLMFPLMAARLENTRGYIDYDYLNGFIRFNTSADYPDDPVSMIGQVPHRWKVGTEFRPHLHWLQTSSAQPNWLIAYKIQNNETTDVIETDYSNYEFRALDTLVGTPSNYPYRQISRGDSIDMTGVAISAPIHVVLFRDKNNTSGLFSGTDNYSGDAMAFQFDFHFQVDSYGSWEEWAK